MSKEGIIEGVISPLLKQLAAARRLAARFGEDGASSELNSEFDKIERNVQDMNEVFRRVEIWEGDTVDELGLIARLVDDISEEGCRLPIFRFKLQTVDMEISNLRHCMTPLHLPPIESGAAIAASSSSAATLSTLPLAPRVSEDWRRFESEKILESSAMSSLQVSYDNLELQLKLCFLCFSIFPANSIIKKRTLIYWWIGEGLVAPINGSTAEEMGSDCFQQLVAKGLIEQVDRKRRPAIDCCKIDPWMRRMLISVAKKAKFFAFDPEGNPTLDFSSTRRACLVADSEGGASSLITKTTTGPVDQLLTLFNVSQQYLKLDKGWFSKARKITTLQLGRWQTSARHHIEVESTEFLEGLRFSKNLAYLSLQGISRISDLPASIGKLANLRILDLRACHNLERLTTEITSLWSLTHLDVSECHLLEHMPKGMGALSELQVLKGFVIGDSRSKHPCRLAEIAKLEKLRKLSLSIGGKATENDEDELNELISFRALRALTIKWGVIMQPFGQPLSKGVQGRYAISKKKKEERYAGLSRMATIVRTRIMFPPFLEKLDLRCFPRKIAPYWLDPDNLTGLKRLYITGGLLSNLQGYPPPPERYPEGYPEEYPDTWTVEVLRLKYLSEMEVVWSDLRSEFPSLVYVEIQKCSKLGSFPCGEDGIWVRERER